MHRLATGIARVVLVAGVVACGTEAQPSLSPAPVTSTATSPRAGIAEPPGARADKFNPRLLRRFRPVRPVIARADGPPSEAQIALGRMLYFDPRLSRDRDLSCNSCHRLERYGVDHERTSVGAHGRRGTRNAPSVYHAAGHFVQFWDGRAPDVEQQAKGPILDPTEMAMASPEEVVAVLTSIPGYAAAFRDAFPGEASPITFEHVADAIGAFERKLVTPSRWDRYVAGDSTALTDAEIEGLKAFTDVGCMVCHTGEYVGGAMFQKAGVVVPWPNQKDQGRYEVTRRAEDRMSFKVPSLRNVAETAPYFHDGSAATLDLAVRVMARHQLGIDLTEDEVASIVTFLRALTGQLPTEYIAAPQLLPDGEATVSARASLLR